MEDAAQSPIARKLPQPEPDVFVTIKPFATGEMSGIAASLVGDAEGKSIATSWRFFINHPKTNTKLWFDMGMSHDLSDYIPKIQILHKHLRAVPSPHSIEEDTVSSGASPAEVKHIICSHAHWDHIRPLPSSFTSANMIVGPGTNHHCAPGFPTAQDSEFDSLIFDPKLRKFPFVELEGTTSPIWKPLGPFPYTYDFFGDGSFYIINAPGHLPGNLAALCRVRTKEGVGKWVLLGGDCAHCNLFTYWPEAPFGKTSKAFFPSGTLHVCVKEAREVVRAIGECKRNEGQNLLVWYAHGEFLEGVWDLEVELVDSKFRGRI